MKTTKLETNYRYERDELTGKVIIVTGANRGLGRAISFDLARAGASVVLVGRDLASLEDVYDDMCQENLPEPIIHGFDLAGATHEHYVDFVDALEKNFDAVDGLIHNAAIAGSLMPIEQYDIKLWYQTMQINLHAPFLLTQFCLPLLKRAKFGRILFLSSLVGREARAYWGAYAVSKFGIEGLMQILSGELENSNIRVNSISPGVVRTKMRQTAYPAEDAMKHPTPEEISAIFVYLMGDKSEKLNGKTLTL